jgi:hypothetical protein
VGLFQNPVKSSSNDEFLSDAAARILGGSTVATSTANMLKRQGIDAVRLGAVLNRRGREVLVGSFRFKFINPDPETPEDFGVFVRKISN